MRYASGQEPLRASKSDVPSRVGMIKWSAAALAIVALTFLFAVLVYSSFH